MEENKKGQNTLYAVIGVATLIVAIIGATFAYFSAQATATGDEIQGGTNDVGASLTLNVERILFGEEAEEGAKYNNLVPAEISVNAAGIEKAVNNKCVANGYTGCHLYKITASSDQKLDAADILLQSFKTSDVIDEEAWKFVVFTATNISDENGENERLGVLDVITGETPENFAESYAINDNETTDEIKGYNIHKDEDNKPLGMDANKEYEYYLLIYLGNKDVIQNPEADATDQTKDATGTYSGKVVLNAAGGKVVANFNATTPVTEP